MSLIENKRVRFDYELQDEFEAGIELLGTEVKSLKNKRGSLVGSYVGIRGKEAFLLNADIPPYQVSNAPKDYDPRRARKLLVTKKELEKLAVLDDQKGLTLVPISVYNKGRNIKISFAAAKGKKTRDKRETIKRREADREMGRSLKKKR